MVYAQDGDASSLEKLGELHRAPIVRPLLAPTGGIVRKMDAEAIGRASLLLGGGRQTPEDPVDFAVGLSGIKKIGERVEANEPGAFLPMQETIKRCSPFGRCWRKQSRSANRFTWPKPGIPGTSLS